MIQRIKVNLIPTYDMTLPVIHLKQYDQTDNSVGKQVELELYYGDDEYTVPDNALVTFQGTKTDKTGYQYEVTSVSGNLVTVDIKSQMTVLSGTHNAELRITKDGSIINSTKFVMDIDSAALSDDTVISKTELPLLEKAIEAETTVITEVKKIQSESAQIETNKTNIASLTTQLGTDETQIATNKSDIATVKGDISSIRDMIYPVGSIYMSVNSTNPSTLFGGTWEQIKDKFLLSCGDTYANGSTGGEETHTLTVDELPKHDHSIRLTWQETVGTGVQATITRDSSLRIDSGESTGATGGGAPHNNMPPYLAVYVWKRTK